MDRWHAIKAFISVLELRSYTAAARQLGISRSHLSKQISSLEDNIGVRLLNRTTKHVSPTDIGQSYYDTCVRSINQLEEAEASLGALRSAPRGSLKILSPKSLAILELVDFTRSFVKRYREIDVSITIEDEFLDIVEHGFDLALRFGEQPSSSLMARKLATFDFIPCAAPDYIKKHGLPRHPSELQDHNCLRHSDLAKNSTWNFHGKSDALSVAVRGPISSNSTVFLRECILRGEGIGFMPSYSVRGDLKCKSLVRLLTKYVTPTLPLYVVYPGGRHLTAKVRMCIDFLVEWFGVRYANKTSSSKRELISRPRSD